MKDKISSENISDVLSNILDVQESVIESAVELTCRRMSYITVLFMQSKTHKRLFDIASGYYKQDIGFIVEDFLREVQDQVGIKFIQQEGDNNQ